MRRRPLHRLGAGILAGTFLAAAVAACSLAVGLDKLTFNDAGACATPCAPAPGPCVQGGCLVGSVCQPDLSPENTPCSAPYDAAGACAADGTCSQTCTSAGDCNTSNPCTTAACDATKRCVYTNLDHTPTPNAKPVYCNVHLCLQGQDTLVVDDDAGPPQVDCNTSSCANGEVVTQPLPYHTACGPSGGQLCNDAGMCACADNGDCIAPETCGGGAAPGFCGCTHDTCVSLHLLCGSAIDHCTLTPIDCDQDAALPGETDTDCGGNADACPTRCARGKGCKVGSDCQSGLFCSPQQVCCNTACADVCRSCDLAGSEGICTAVPRYQQVFTGAECSGNMACDGQGNCKKTHNAGCNTTSGCIGYCDTSGHCT